MDEIVWITHGGNRYHATSDCGAVAQGQADSAAVKPLTSRASARSGCGSITSHCASRSLPPCGHRDASLVRRPNDRLYVTCRVFCGARLPL